MEIAGKFKDASVDFDGNASITFTTTDVTAVKQIADTLKDVDLDIEVKKHKNKRSNQANKLLWELIGRIASAEKRDKWEIYLEKLKKWGQFTYIDILPEAVESFSKQWRELQIVGEHEVNGKTYVECLCFFGSSKYSTAEFSALLDGIIQEMTADGLPVPTDTEMNEALKNWRPE